MNKSISTLLLISLLFNAPASAQEETTTTIEVQTQTPLQEIGLEEAPAQRPKDDSNLRNWLFAAGTVICATVAAVVVSLSPGSPPNGTNTPN